MALDSKKKGVSYENKAFIIYGGDSFYSYR